MKNYYNILEVEPKATLEQIKSQYRFLLHAWHPDKFPSGELKNKAEEKIKDINEAYNVLSDPAKRESYDKAFRSNSPPHPPTQPSYSQPPQSQSNAQSKQYNDGNARGETKKLSSVFNKALLVGIGIGLLLFVYNLQINGGNLADAFYKGISSVFIYGLIYSVLVWIWRVGINNTVKEPFSSEAGFTSAIVFIVLMIMFFLYISVGLFQPSNRQLSSIESNPAISTSVPSTSVPSTIAPSTQTPITKNTPTLPLRFPDTFSDNRNLWGLDYVVKIVGGTLLFGNVPANQSYRTSCSLCTINSLYNQVTVDVITSGEDYGLGLVIDDRQCNPSLIIFQVNDISGAYYLGKYVQETINKGHWEPIEYGARRSASPWINYSGIKKGQVNKLSAVYGFFNDNLIVYLYINDKYLNWFQVPDFNKSLVCSVGLYVDGREGSFDNFIISAKEVPTKPLPTLEAQPQYFDFSLCNEVGTRINREGYPVSIYKCPAGYPSHP